MEEGEALIQAMLAAGKHVVIEPLTTDEETANKWADLAIKYHIDGNLGFYFKSVSDKLKAAGIDKVVEEYQRQLNEYLAAQ